jgi:Fungalysin metallopeptidase (M36)/Secretion system C-terminal sorting domain/Fungalysin/Thermolysin Propeptide Motif
MKKIVLFLLLVAGVIGANSQDLKKTDALKLVENNLTALGFSQQNMQNVIVSNAYFNQTSGTELVYLQQSHKGLPVYNQVQTLAFKNGKLVSSAGKHLKGIEKLSNRASAAPSIKAESAVRKSMAVKNLSSTGNLSETSMPGNTKLNFGKAGISKENITAELMWVPLNDGQEVRLAWQVYLVPLTSSDYWLINVDAATNQVISETNLTVYCQFEANNDHQHQQDCTTSNEKNIAKNALRNPGVFGSNIVNGATYRVIPYPAESPIHAGGAPDLRTNPWTLAPGNATSLKWHSTGTTDYTITRGNNVWAYEDRDGVNSTIGLPGTSTTIPDPLTFDFVPDFTVTPTQTTPVPNQQFNITNLFYWNNIVHDLTYQYGFTEVAGNFQANNQSRGGAGNDFVVAEAQDGGGTNNANFSTPADGGSGRMQMYLWNGNPQKDGDVDNGIIVHEYSHGISNRLTGGPAQAGCLGNQEQMGEGWSDYFALMATHNWATASINDGFGSPRGIGTYAANQSATGVGIRPRRYTTNMAVNEITYANLPSQAVPHGVGFVWCTMLWDMTWEIIQQAGINPNLFDPTGAGGNTIALKLVTEGMKLQPCSPGFVDGRNAILQADQLLYNGQYRCAIIAAFARRGLGLDAKQGSSGSRNDGTAGFSTVESNLTLTQSVTQQLEGLNVTYTNRVAAGPCSGISNYLLTDTLPSNVTYVSGGSYNPATRVVSFPVNVNAGQAQNYAFTVMINNGSWFPTANLIDEQVTSSSIPASWTTSSINGINFTVSSAQSHSAPFSFFGVNPVIASDYSIATNSPVPLGATPPVFSFWHNYNTEDGWDGGVVEISTNNGASWLDLGANMIENGYNGSMGTGSNNPLGGRSAFTGNSAGFIKTSVSLAPYANQSALFRFRVGSDDNTAITGWYIDDILLQSKAMVKMRSSLFNASGVRVNTSDTTTIILQNAGCTPVAITTQPANASACAGNNVSFTVAATGSNLTYQWQVSTDLGVTYTNIPAQTAATLNLTAITAGMNNNRYRVIINNACPSTVTSTGAILTVSNAATVTGQPVNTSVCLNGNASFSASATGSNLTYQWQVSTDAGLNYTNITGATSATLNLTNVLGSMNGNLYRVVVFSCGPTGTNSNAATLTITNPANITLQPVSVTACPNDNVSFSVAVNGTSLSYQWQVKSSAAASFSNIPGATSATLNLTGVNIALNGNQYRVIINGTCTVDLISNAATLNINTPVTINTQPLNRSGCAGSNVSFVVAATGTSLSYQWQVSVNGGQFINLPNGNPYSGVNTNVLSISGVTSDMNGYTYRVIVSGPPCGAVISNVASLTTFALPAVVLTAAEYNRLTPAVPSTLYTTISPVGVYTYQWFRNNTLLPGVNSNSYPVNVDRLGNYSVTVTDINGCSVSSNLVSISDSASSQLFVYPNPNNGQFQVRYFNPNNNQSERTLTVYDAKGARVYSKKYATGMAYDRMDVILTNAQAGVYSIDLRDNNGKRLASGSVIIQ